ncbi:MAG: NADH-quinone oxidoreductase subunit NuoE [Deltaproteobacteria bacterium]|nr:NADH-quinone oxidoreductase subunit NuoE [Deltaproteobacteria bacterium]
MNVEFSAENKKEFEKIVAKYPSERRRAALLPTLWLAQRQWGWISNEVMEYVAGLLELSPIKVLEVVTFYTMFNQKPVGKYHLQVCRTLSCEVCGKENIVSHLKNKLGIKLGETTADGKFTLTEVECLGSCGTGPMMQLNDDFYESLTPEKVDEILGQLK